MLQAPMLVASARLALCALALGAAIPQSSNSPSPADRFWPQWRGPYATGVSKTATPPLEWSETKNIRWKVEIPGRGSASPVVWGDRVFVLTAVPAGVHHGRVARSARRLAAARAPLRGARHRSQDGQDVWERTAREEAPHEASHPDNGTWASSSAITDGRARLIASFESRGLYAYDMNGTLVWQTDLGDKQMRNQFGEGSTPALLRQPPRRRLGSHGRSRSSSLSTSDRQGVVARQSRDEIDTWATPLVVEHGGRTQVIVPGMNRVRSYDLETGEVVWDSAGLTMNPIPSPVVGDGLVFVDERLPRQQPEGDSRSPARRATSPAPTRSSGRSIATRRTCRRRCSMTASSISSRSNNGLLSAFDARTGKPHFQAAAAAIGARSLRVAGRRCRAGVHSVARRHDRRHQHGADLRNAGGE